MTDKINMLVAFIVAVNSLLAAIPETIVRANSLSELIRHLVRKEPLGEKKQ